MQDATSIIPAIIFFIAYSLVVNWAVRYIEQAGIRLFWGFTVSALFVLFLLNLRYALNQEPALEFIQSYIHLDYEGTIPNQISAFLMMTCTGLTWFLVLQNGLARKWQTLCWLMLATMFSVATYDEWLSPYDIHGQDWLLLTYAAAGVLGAAGLAALAWQNQKANRHWWYIAMIVGLLMIGFGGIVLDNNWLLPLFGKRPFMFEEPLETFGILTIVVMLLQLVYAYLPAWGWRGIQTWLVAGFAVIAIQVIATPQMSSTYVYLTDERQADGTRFDDNVVLDSVGLPRHTLQPGDTVQGTLYFVASNNPTGEYGFSAHLLALPTLQSLAQQDEVNVGNGLTYTWVPGMISHQPVELSIPQTVSQPTGLWLTIRLWSSAEGFFQEQQWDAWREETSGLAVLDTPHPRLSDEQLQIAPLVVVPAADQVPLAGQTTRFANGVELTAAPRRQTVTAGDTLDVTVQWATEQALPQDLSHILHLIADDGSDFWVFDRPPFNQHLPSTWWPAGFRATDRSTLTLPPDLPAGTYTLFTGLYDPVNQVRLAVEGDHTNNLVPLMTLVLEAS